jgi:predicted phage terminase large subunit-like protein
MVSQLKWSKYIPHYPTEKQMIALMSTKKELLFGGALGGGKSDFLLMSCLQYMDVPGYASAIFRKQLTDLKQPGALLDRAKKWLSTWKKHGVKYIPSEHCYVFPTTLPNGDRGEPAKLVFCYIGDAHANDRYQSAEYQTICFDEISQWETASDYEFMTTRLRRTTCKTHGKYTSGPKKNKPRWVNGCPECELKRNIPVRLRGATNPGGLGGNWIMKRYQIIPDPKYFPDRRDAIKAAMAGIRVPFIGTHPQRDFVPSYIDDNPHLDLDDYAEFLDNLNPELKAQLKDGNWLARADSRFKREDARYFEIYEGSFKLGPTMRSFSEFELIFMTMDFASTADEGVIDDMVHKKSPSYTSLSVWGMTRDKDLFLLDNFHGRVEVPDIVTEAKRLYLRWRPKFMKAEFNGVGAGPAQYMQRLGLPIKKLVKSKDKIENSTSARLLMKAGKIYFPINASWLETIEDEVFSWIGLPSETDDIIDNLSDAANEVGPVDESVNADEIITKIVNGFNYPKQNYRGSPTLSLNPKPSPFLRYH